MYRGHGYLPTCALLEDLHMYVYVSQCVYACVCVSVSLNASVCEEVYWP